MLVCAGARRSVGLLLLSVVGVVFTGCGGGASVSSVPSGALANRYIPTVRNVGHHPDSLAAVSLQAQSEGIELAFTSDRDQIHRKWSCKTDLRSRSYATLWSREVLLASLEFRYGISTLSRGLAKKMLRDHMTDYERNIRVDIFAFTSEGPTVYTEPSRHVQLRVNDTTYAPRRQDYGPLRTPSLPRDDAGLYRHNTFHFRRIVNGKDVLEEAKGLSVEVDGVTYYEWAWDG